MKQFAISVFLLLFHCCLAPHFACPKDRPFLSSSKKCKSFSDICINYKSEECEFGIMACKQCPMSNFSSAILERVLKTIYGNEDKNYFQTRIETNLVQKFPTDGDLQSILTIVSLLVTLFILIFLYFIYQYMKDRKRRNQERNYINLLSSENQKDHIVRKLEEIAENLKNPIITKLEDIEKNQNYSLITKLEYIANELTILPNKMKGKKPTEICFSWKDAENGFVPSGAIEVGNSCIVARAVHKGEYIPGKLIPNDKCVYICYGNKEKRRSDYQVLVDTSVLNKPVLEWKYACFKEIPPEAIIGGTDAGRALYIARAEIEGEDVLGKFLPEHRSAYFPFKDKEVHREEPIKILCYSTM